MENENMTPDSAAQELPARSEAQAGGEYRPAPVYTPAEPQKKPRREYKPYEIAFAWITFALSYLFCRMFPAEDHPLGALLFTLTLFACGAVFVILRKKTVSVYSVLIALSAIAFSFSFFVSSNPVIHICSMMWITVAYIYWIYSACGNSIAPIGDVTLMDVFKAVFVMPWSSLGAFAGAAFGGGKTENGRKIGKSILWIFTGLCIAIIPTSVVFGLLSYDEKFSALIKNLFSFDFQMIFSHVGSLILAVPIAFFGFAYLMAASENRHKERMTAEDCRKAGRAVKVFPQLLVYFTLIPMLVVYVLFFISQADYYLAAFGGGLPAGSVSRSEYARSGFFQLCTVSGINAFALVMMSLFTRLRGDGKRSVWQRVFSGILSVFTLVLIATAAAKMILYIDYLGLTPLRVYTMWFMVLLAFGFLYALILQIVPKFNFMAFMAATFVILYGAIALTNVDGFIARYNADRYIAGTLEEFDANAMSELGDSAIPEMIRVAKYMESKEGFDNAGLTVKVGLQNSEQKPFKSFYKWREQVIAANPGNRKEADQYVTLVQLIESWEMNQKIKDDKIFSVTLPLLRAEAAVKEVCGEAGGTK